MASPKMRMWMRMRVYCYRFVAWNCVVTFVALASLMTIHLSSVPDNNSMEYLFNDPQGHRLERSQPEPDVHPLYSPTEDDMRSDNDSGGDYDYMKTFPPLHGDEWHVLRDNLQKLDALDGDDFVVLKAKARAVEYCNPSSYRYNGAEGSVPKGFRLQQVQIVIRHGHRSPMYRLGGNKTKMSCLLSAKTSPNPRVAAFAEAMGQLKSELPLHGRPYNLGLLPSDGTCRGAQLTPEGSIQLLNLGDYLRTLYIERWGLLPTNVSSGDLYFRSTTYSRTFQSGIAFLYGFLGGIDMDILQPKFTEGTAMYSEYCDILQVLSKTVSKQSTKYRWSNELFLSAMSDLQQVFNMTQNKIPGINALLDGLSGYMCTNVELPCMRNDTASCITWQLIGKLWDFLDDNGRHMLDNYDNIKKHRLTMYPFLRTLAHRAWERVANNGSERLLLYSGHDLTVSPLVTALGVHDGKWPPFASRVVFELYSEAHREETHFIRILYNGADVTPRTIFCRHKKLTMGLCPLEHFIRFATKGNLQAYGYENYRNVCKRKSKSSVELPVGNVSNATSS